jgi:hypothetical protein
MTADHLTASTSGRGFKRLPDIPGEYGGSISVYESSAARGPHVWLQVTVPVDPARPDGRTVEVPVHLAAENAHRLAEQLLLLVREHYQGDATPESGDPR